MVSPNRVDDSRNDAIEQHVPLSTAAARLGITVHTLVGRCSLLGIRIVQLGPRTRRLSESSIQFLLKAAQ